MVLSREEVQGNRQNTRRKKQDNGKRDGVVIEGGPDSGA